MHEPSGFYAVRSELHKRLAEPAPGRVQLLTGPRQVGKTTILLDIAREWGEAAVYAAADAPEAALAGWWEAQWRQAVQRARSGPAALLLDEVQYLPNWSRLVKSGVDSIYRDRVPLHIVITGSAALQVGAGARETMAGRFERIILRHWTPRDITEAFGLSSDAAVESYVRFGCLPGGMNLMADLPRWRAYVQDSVIDPAVGRDLLVLEAVRRPALLRQVFAVCAAHPAEVLSLPKIAGALTERGALETVAHYLDLLGEAFLVAAVSKHSTKELRRRASPRKLIPLNNAYVAASRPEPPPTAITSPEAWGRWLENACLAFALNCGQSARYWREEPLEVDVVLEGSWGKWAVEIKGGGYAARDIAGLLEFCRRWPDYRPLVVCDDEHLDEARRVGVDALPWRSFLWDGPAG